MDGLLEAQAYSFKWDALHDGIEKSLHDQPLGFPLRDAARLEIKHGFLFKFANRGAVGAADIIG